MLNVFKKVQLSTSQNPECRHLLGAQFKNRGLNCKIPHHSEHVDTGTMEIGSIRLRPARKRLYIGVSDPFLLIAA